MVTINYNGKSVEVEDGKVAALPCNGKLMKTNVVVTFNTRGVVECDGTQKIIEAGETGTLHCGGRLMRSDIVIKNCELEIEDTWENIGQAISDGTYKAKYSLGDYKTITLSTGENVQMQIIAFDTDDKSDGSGKAAITWLSKELVGIGRYVDRGDAVVNWPLVSSWTSASNALRPYVETTLYELIPETVQRMITSVTKTYYQSSTIRYQQVTAGKTLAMSVKTWIPSGRELFGSPEESGCDYTNFFTSNDHRVKLYDGEAMGWWTRSGYVYYDSNACLFVWVTSDGKKEYRSEENTQYAANKKRGVPLGFCIG